MESPSTKLKRELAALDSSSDEDRSPPKRQRKWLLKPASPTQLTASDIESEDEDEDDALPRPRGRFASRMLASNPKKAGSSNSVSGSTPTQNDNENDIDLRRSEQRSGRRSQTPELALEMPLELESPGLFVSPNKAVSPTRSQSDIDNEELPTIKSSKLKALVTRKAEERKTREAEQARNQAERIKRFASEMDLGSASDGTEDITDDEDGRQLTQKSTRPSRKASKKAMEEMNRETQRMDRSRQLAHQCLTKTKVTKSALFDRFNFSTGPPAPEEKPASPKRGLNRSSRPSSPASHLQSEVDMKNIEPTPPSSPPIEEEIEKPATKMPVEISGANDEIPPIEEFLLRPPQDRDSEKNPHVGVQRPSSPLQERMTTPTRIPKRHFRIKAPEVHTHVVELDDDDNLVINKPSHLDKFDKMVASIPIKQAKRKDRVLDALIGAVSPGKERNRCGRRGQKNTMSISEHQTDLVRRAREQAREERERRIEMLRAKGVVIETEEDRLKLEEEVDDIVTKARREAEEIMEREREAAKEQRKKERNTVDPLAFDDSEDESYVGSDEEEEEKNLELSGSEDEDEARYEQSDKETAGYAKVDSAGEDDDEEEDVSINRTRHSRKQAHIVSDDEDDLPMEMKATPNPKSTPFKAPDTTGSTCSKTPKSVLRSATKPFIPGIPIPLAAPAGIGLTQIFQGTMDNGQSQPFPGITGSIAPMPSLALTPKSPFDSQSQVQEDRIAESQVLEPTQSQDNEVVNQSVEFNFRQPQSHGLDSPLQEKSQVGTDEADLPTPTQDGGFIKFTPLKQRFVDDAPVPGLRTENSVEVIHESPLAQRKGRLRRKDDRIPTAIQNDADNDGTIPATASLREEENEFAVSSDAFKQLHKTAKRVRKLTRYNKKRSKAKEMVEEQAEESDDEYAGLGGADGEDSDDSVEDEEVKAMIDDDKTHINEEEERRLAAFHAERERLIDEKEREKLFKDITTGGLRKRRRGAGGADYDLSDSDDGSEAKRRAKRKQFERMQKALFADERVSKVAENPRNMAFLKSLEDMDGSDDEMDFLADMDHPLVDAQESSQSQGDRERDSSIVPDSQPVTTAAVMPQNPRRANRNHMVKPRNMTAIRESLSDLLEDSQGFSATARLDTRHGGEACMSQLADESDEDELSVYRAPSSDKENHIADNGKQKKGIVDRVALSRQNSSSSSTSSVLEGVETGTGGRMAFVAPSSSSTARVPALLRRATTNSSLLSTNTGSDTAVTGSGISSSKSKELPSAAAAIATTSGGFGEDVKLKKRNTSKTSGVSYLARENERTAALRDRKSVV